MKQRMIFEAKDGTVFDANNYPDIEAAENACRNYEAVIDCIGTDVILLNYGYEEITDYKKADFLIFNNNDIKHPFVEYCINLDGAYDIDYFDNSNYFLRDLEDDCWFDVEATYEMWKTRLEKLKNFHKRG